MRVPGAIILAVALSVFAGQSARASDRAGLAVGGGILAGGYFGELKHDWDVGMGGSLFIQTPVCCDFEGRLRASMLWNDGSDREVGPSSQPDFGAREGDRTRSFRRSSYELSLLWRIEGASREAYAIPYLGAGLSTYERNVEFRVPPESIQTFQADINTHETSAWDWGFHGIAGMRFYRTSGIFLGLEGTLHAIDTPKEWTAAYDISLLLGVELNQ